MSPGSPEREKSEGWVGEFKAALSELNGREINGIVLKVLPENFSTETNDSNPVYWQKIIFDLPEDDISFESTIHVKAFHNLDNKVLEIVFDIDPRLQNKDIYQNILKYFSNRLPEYILQLPILHNNTKENILVLMQKLMKENAGDWQAELKRPIMKFAHRALNGTNYSVIQIEIIYDDNAMGVLPRVICKSGKSSLPEEDPKLTIQESISVDDVASSLEFIRDIRNMED